MGGLSKKAYQFNRLSKESNLPFLIVDGGSLLFKRNPVVKSQEKQARATAKGIVQAYNQIGYDAVGVSSQDLALGLDFLLDLQKEAKFDWLSANLVNRDSNKLLFKPTTTRKIGNIKIGIVGLTDRLPLSIKGLEQDIEIIPWQDTLPQVMTGLSKDHDFIVLLTSLPAGECQQIAKAFPAINLIIHAKNNVANLRPTNLTESTAMVGTGKKGKYIGIMNISWHPESKWLAGNHEILAERDRLNRQLAQMRARPERKYNYEKLLKRLTTIEKLIQEENSSAKNSTPVSSYQNRFMAMEKSLPDHPSVLEVVNAINRQINKINRKPATRNINNGLANRGFIGWQKCRECHNDRVMLWRKTRHASSLLTLIKKNQQFNLDCLPCHVTGVDIKDPAAAIGMPSDLQMVGCENCHGPGALHSTNPVSNKTIPVTEKTCLTCHVPDHDESFDFASDIKKLKCKF